MAQRSTRPAATAAIVTVLVGLAGIAGWLSGTGLLGQDDDPNPVHTIPDPEMIDNADQRRQELLDDGFEGILGGSEHVYVYLKISQTPRDEHCSSRACYDVSAVVLQRCDTLTITLDLESGLREETYVTESLTFTDVTPGEVTSQKLQTDYGHPDRIHPSYNCSRN